MKVKRIYLAIVGTLIVSLQSYAQIPVSGVVSGTWSQGDTMEVVGDLYLLTDSTLVIEPGVVVKFMDYYRFYVYGLLLANGTASNFIYFTCDLIQNQNRWGGIRFTNADSLCSMSYCVIEKGLAQNPEPDGGGVYCSNSSPTISHCIFNSNNSNVDGGGIGIYNNSSPAISNCTIDNNTSNNVGGGININESSPTFSNCTITDNSASSGGGLNSGINSFPEFTDCQINANYASEDGGAIYCNNSTLIFSSCDITNNHLSSGHVGDKGAGVFAQNCILTLTDCNITGNYNSYRGGGMFLDNDSLYMNNCTISNNSASGNGGGMYLIYSANGNEITNCTISNNSASNNGGGIWVSGFTIGLTNCELSNNTAVRMGGGMFIKENRTSLNNCNFIANHAPGQIEGDGGGGIYMAAFSGSGIDLTDCWFEDNTAYRGGGIYGNSWNSSSSIENCTFLNNSADPQGGGAIYNNRADVTISDCLFEANECMGNGGGINNYDASPSISKCLFVNNSAVNTGGCIYNGEGGAPNINRCTMYGNSASFGGSIASVNSSPIINSIIVDSSNSYGIYFGSGSSNTNVRYCDFNNNLPINFGGSDVPSGLGIINGTNYNGDPCDTFSNIFLEPLFVDAGSHDFHLQIYSPCIDGGDPNILNDPDGTIADIGAFYYHQQPVGSGEQSDLPLSFKLHQNYPNPFNPLTKINYQIPHLIFVTLNVYDVLGNEIITLVNEEKSGGSYKVKFNAIRLPSGIYFYRLQAGDFVETRKMVLMK